MLPDPLGLNGTDNYDARLLSLESRRDRPEINRSRLRACKPSLRSHLISNVDRTQKRLIVIHKDERASRAAITRGLVVQS